AYWLWMALLVIVGRSGGGMLFACGVSFFFFFNDTATTEIYTLSLHDALPISCGACTRSTGPGVTGRGFTREERSEEHTSELQSLTNLVCRLLLEKKTNHQ